ncbi:MAG: TatD family hydrolase [Chitinophagaceae bacterium]|nr:TatD family hydrolase [Chitinophagaceae bacterium]
MIIDTHCHLYLPQFKADIQEVMKRAASAGVERFYLPAIDSSTTNDMLLLEEQFKGKCFSMIGLHPCSVSDNVNKELEMVHSWLQQRSFAAVGEIGLDFYHDITFKETQFMAFRTQIDWALEYNLPIVIHSRNAMRETIDLINEYKGKGLNGIFHCFSGNENDAGEIIEAGFYLGIGGVVTYKNSGLAEVIERTSLEHLVLETDAPYLAPMPFRGKRNESAYLRNIAGRISEIKGVEIDEVVEITTANAKKIFDN